jgi:hypothetical protein
MAINDWIEYQFCGIIIVALGRYISTYRHRNGIGQLAN